MGKNKANTAALDANMEKAKQEGKLLYRIKKSKTSYLMLAPYLILFTFFIMIAGFGAYFEQDQVDHLY